ncbi:glycosyltransferase, partial [Rhodopila globiformis]
MDAAPGDANAALALATLKLQENDPDAGRLFASVSAAHDVREAWIGLAIAHHWQADSQSAGQALAHALSRHAMTAVPRVTDSIVRSLEAPGWCALNPTGVLTVRLMMGRHRRPGPIATLDGEPLALRAERDGERHSARLPDHWRRARAIRVQLDGSDLLGSPVDVSRIARVEGFVDSHDGDLHGWAWCPNNPDDPPVLSILPGDGSAGLTVTASDYTTVATTSPLARPRAFRVPPEALRRFAGPLRVCAANGRALTGSPVDPSAERRSAEAASRIIAERFPAPGTRTGPAIPDLENLGVPAHITGTPATSGYRKRPVDVVVPVYGELELTLACLDSLLKDLPSWAQILVVDDASPDPRVAAELGKLAAAKRIKLFTRPVNRGFPGTANFGMSQSPARDVVLLNSDTLVPPGWLASLRDAAYAAPDIGTATPFSNNATILSYPSTEHPNAIPDLDDTVHLDALAQRANFGCLVDIPTAVGFCTYIKRDCLNATGLLRDDVFGQGYGEENDFCIRARHLGWRHVAVPGVFVAHVGGQSFGSAKQHLITRNLRKLNQLHPGYDALVADFIKADPMAEPRRRLDLARWETFRTGAPSVLLVTHGRGGGVQRHVAERAAALRAEGKRPIVLWPVASRQGDGRDCVLGNGPEGGTPNLRFAVPGELDALAAILAVDKPLRAEVHSMIGHDHGVFDLFRRLTIPYSIVVHDYAWLCPRINLVGVDRHYCGEPDLPGCDGCVADAGTMNDEDTRPRDLRERSARELAGAAAVIVPSDDVAIRIRRHFPAIEPQVRYWEDDSAVPPAEPSPVAEDGVRRVCVVGAIGIEKGYEVLLACARDAANRGLRLRFHLVGHSCDDDRLLATGTVRITGRYEEHAAVDLIRRQQAQLAWLPAVWPETWSYTLTQAWQAGLNVLAFDIGAVAERIRRAERGWLCPLGLSPQALNDRMLGVRPLVADREAPLFVGGRRQG